MQNEPSVSIVITYFDYANFLAETVASVARQTYRDFEVIIVDDCSPGVAAQEIVNGADLPRLTILRLDNNGGPARACNIGVRVSRAPLIVALDSDDLIEETFLEKTVSALSDEELGGVFTSVGIFGDIELTYRPECTALAIMSGRPGPTTFLYRRCLYEAVGGYKEHVYHHDNEFWLVALKQGWKFQCIDEPLYKYRKHGAGRSRLHRTEELAELVREHKELFTAELETVAAAWEQRHWETEDRYQVLDSAFATLSREYEHLHREFHSLLDKHMELVAERQDTGRRLGLLRRALTYPRLFFNRQGMPEAKSGN